MCYPIVLENVVIVMNIWKGKNSVLKEQVTFLNSIFYEERSPIEA